MEKEVKIDVKNSFIQWSGSKIGTTHTGKIFYKGGVLKEVDGKLTEGEFVVDMNTITNEDLQGEWREKFLAHIKSPDFFIVEKFPESKLSVKEITDSKIKGNLTIKDKTHPVEFDYERNGNEYSGKLEFNRTDYDMVYMSKSFFKNLGDKFVHDKISLDFKFVTL